MREHERVQVTMPIRFKNQIGIAKNVSRTGIYVEIKSASGITSEISFDVEMNTPFGSMNLKCKGVVVRKVQKKIELE